MDKPLNTRGRPAFTGWLPPRPDLRDYTEQNAEVKEITKKLSFKPVKEKAVASVDLREWCSPVEDQGNLGSCTAHAGVSIVEYYEKRAFGRHIDGSRLFLYKTTRNLMQATGDTGAFLRCTMGSLAMCGLPPEKYWPYNIAGFDKEPPAFVYSLADNYEGLKYFRHDPEGYMAQGARRMANQSGEGILNSVKKYLQAGIPAMFGFWGFPSYDRSDIPGGIPYPCKDEAAEWGHAVVAVGYDDNKKIRNLFCKTETTGALLIRNSWGAEWGEEGYGWLPYDYLRDGLATDFWSIISMNWIDTGQFGL